MKAQHEVLLYMETLILHQCWEITGVNYTLFSHRSTKLVICYLLRTQPSTHSAASVVPKLPPMSTVVFFWRTASSTA